ncbi:hypothetical protein WHR41_02128 [Cladosporium halotolerans]|uniref:VPS9 domain-containing protein n=1 Tax=Cladosporium halotolerans TaxID=1052096 RepID=A0AB34KXV2_9PEZI
MSSGESTQNHDSRPRALHTSRSFTRMESPSSTPSSPRKRANTTQVSGIASIPEARSIDASPELFGKDSKADVFENRHDEEDEGSETEVATPELNLPSTLDELPIEIRSMTERFLDSLSAKVHPAPLSAETLSDMFQDFYERAASQISIHIATLASRLGRKDSSPTATMRSSKGRARAGSTAKRNESPSSTTSGGEMLTVSEVSDRKKARKQLELKRIALEEAVERAVCERIYDKLWKHRTTDDDARDEKLRSRTAALSLVGIGLKELHVDIEPSDGPTPKTAAEKEAEIHSSLAPAREALERMDDERYPLGKLQHLTVAHKSIVETLSQLFPSSSSADEILPTLIYTLITSSDLDLNVISNLNFIQRFRASSKVDGESAYCLVNLEASISFLETVDLSSLRADEQPEGPAKSSSRPSTPNTDKTAPAQPAVNRSLKPETTAVSALSHDKSTPDLTNKPLPSTTTSSRPGAPHRRLSSMVQAQADRFEASRENLLQAADKVYDSINGTLENSLASLFGRLKDQVPNNNPTLPKTLEEARKLVSTPPAATPEDEYPPSITLSGRSSPADDPLTSEIPSANQKPPTTSRPLELLAGRRPTRDRSADSTSSTTSGSKRAPFPSSSRSPQPPTSKPAGAGSATDEPLNAAANFITAINPLNRFASAVPSFPRFGRAASTGASTPSPQPPPAAQPPPPPQKEANADAANELEKTRSRVSEGGSDLNAIEALAELRRIKPPRRRFLEVQGAGELRLGEVEELLSEYRRLAKAIGEAVAQ